MPELLEFEDLVKLASEDEMAMRRAHQLVDGLWVVCQLEAEILHGSADLGEKISKTALTIGISGFTGANLLDFSFGSPVPCAFTPHGGSPETVPATSTDTQALHRSV